MRRCAFGYNLAVVYHITKAADGELQRTIADAYDADPAHWARRVQIAFEIIEAGLAVTPDGRLHHPNHIDR